MKIQSMRWATAKAVAPSHGLRSADVAQWSATKDVDTEGAVREAVSPVFADPMSKQTSHYLARFQFIVCR